MTLMEPNSLIFLNFKVVQWPFVFLQNTPDDPFLNQNHWIALNARFSFTADPQLTTPLPHSPPRMRSQTLPFLLKKNENYLKIIKVPLHGHKTFGATHTIQYHCIKYCSQCRRGYYNGLNRAAPPEKVTFFRLQVHEREGSFFIVEVYERDICHFSQLKDQNEISHRCTLWM